MKNKYLLYFMSCLLFLSCSEDKGNYDYTSIDELEITGIKNAYTAVIGDSLNIPVTLKHTVDTKDPDMSYNWEIDGRSIANTRELHILPPSDLSFGNKLCRYTVTNKITGMKYFQTFNTNIVSPFNWGYYFLTEKEDHSTVLSYFSVAEDNTKFVETTSVSGVEFGNNPQQIMGTFGYISTIKDYFWTIYFLTKEGEAPVILTENATFIPSGTISTSNFVDQNSGYVFAPEEMKINRQGNPFFLSQGQFISYSKGVLYRPARHNKEYKWSHPVFSQAGGSFMFVYDNLSHKYYVIKPQANDPSQGIIGDSYAYDQVVEISDCPDLQGHSIIGTAPAMLGNKDFATIVTANNQGINLIKVAYDRTLSTGNLESTETLAVSGADSDTKALLIKQDWFFTIGNMIYTSPVLLPALDEFIKIPAEYGKIVNLNASAMQSQLVVTTYDSESPAEMKGSVIFIDITTKKMTPYKHVIHKCVSILGANTDPYGWGDHGDGK